MKYGRINLNIDYSKAGVDASDKYTLPADSEVPCPGKVAGNHPYLDCYLLDNALNTYRRRSVIICPGGAYYFTSQREAEAVAMKFLSKGIQAFILWYSVAPAIFPMALMEAASAVKIVRDHADEWCIDPDKIAIMGFSAGGHLAGSLSVMWNKGFLAESLGVRESEIRPNGSILCYPVITSGEKAHRGSFDNLLRGLSDDYLEVTSLEKQVDENTPPTFIWHTWTDEMVPVENSLYYMLALREHNVSCEAHIYKEGPHGISLANRETARDPIAGSIVPEAQDWIDHAVTWLNNL